MVKLAGQRSEAGRWKRHVLRKFNEVLKSQLAVFLPLIFISALFWVLSSIYGLTETIDTGGALKNSFKPPTKKPIVKKHIVNV